MNEPRRIFLKAFAVLVAFFMVAPTFVVVPIAFTSARTFQFPPPGWSTQWFKEVFSDPAWMDSFLLSIRVGLVVTVVGTFLGTLAAFALTRGRGAWRVPVRGLMLAPMIVPGVITAIGIFYVFLQLRLVSNFWGFALAHTIVVLPFVGISVSTSLQGMDRQLERASASLGAGPVSTLMRITLPLILPGMLTGALFAFLLSFDEAMISLFLSGPFNRTLPVQLYQSVTATLTPTIAAASTLIISLSTLILIVAAIIGSLRRARNV